MSEVSSAESGSFYGARVHLGEQNMAEGRISFGGVSISATGAVEFVMMHRTEVLKQVGADRTELAEKHLASIRKARQYIIDLADMKKFAEDRSYRDRIPTTPEMVDYLKNEVGCNPGEYRQRVLFYASALPKLPESIRKHYELCFDRFGNFKPQWGGKFGIERIGPVHHNRFQIHNALVVNKDDIDTIKEEVNNYVDQLNDGNNLFIIKFKNVVNTMNGALDGANRMADKSHDIVKNLIDNLNASRDDKSRMR